MRNQCNRLSQYSTERWYTATKKNRLILVVMSVTLRSACRRRYIAPVQVLRFFYLADRLYASNCTEEDDDPS